MLNGKTEYLRPLVGSVEPAQWKILTAETVNSIVRDAIKEGVGGDANPRAYIESYICSEDVPAFNPIQEYLDGLPAWDGENHLAKLFERIPGITSEVLSWLCIWLRSAVAHWKQMDTLHGNECMPVLIGSQGCGKSTFAYRLLPPDLRQYYLDSINFGNKFDADMALTNNLLGNLDEFTNMGPTQQGKLKYCLSRPKVNGRPAFGKSQDDRPRFASFLATTNDEHPLTDPTGSRRYICVKIPLGKFINNEGEINYEQLYAQILFELQEKKVPYWFTNDQVARIQEANLAFFKSGDLETMLLTCFEVPEKDETGNWYGNQEILRLMQVKFPNLVSTNSNKLHVGKTLKSLGCASKHTKYGQVYQLKLKSA